VFNVAAAPGPLAVQCSRYSLPLDPLVFTMVAAADPLVFTAFTGTSSACCALEIFAASAAAQSAGCPVCSLRQLRWFINVFAAPKHLYSSRCVRCTSSAGCEREVFATSAGVGSPYVHVHCVGCTRHARRLRSGSIRGFCCYQILCVRCMSALSFWQKLHALSLALLIVE
jgi:hypothetical protein